MNSAAVAFNIVFVLALVLAFSKAGALLGPKPRHEGDADMPYETGERPFESAIDRMAVLYYRFAVLFVVFDVDLAFLLPWALNRGALDFQRVMCVGVFTAVIFFMLAYFWRRGVLECQ